MLGTVGTKHWNGMYQALERSVPNAGIRGTKQRYLPLPEIIHLTILLEGQVFCIAVCAEEVDNPLLLLRGEQLFATVIAIISTVTAKIRLHLFTQMRIVLLLHLFEKQFEPVCHPLDTCLLKMRTCPILISSRIYCRAPSQVVWGILACKKAQAFRMTRTFLAEA